MSHAGGPRDDAPAAEGPATIRLGARLIAGARSQAIVASTVAAAMFVAQVGVGRRYGGSGLGEYTVASLAIYLITTVSVLAVPWAAARRVAFLHQSGEPEQERRVTDSALTLALLLATLGGVVLALVWPVLMQAPSTRDVPFAVLVLASVSTSLLGYASHIFHARLLIALAGVVLIAQPLSIVVALAWDTLGGDVRPREIAVIGAIAGGTAGALALLASGIRPGFDVAELRRLLPRAVELAPLTYTNVLSVWVDRLVVSVFLGPAALGIYQAASSLVEGSIRLLRSGGAFFVSAYGRATARGDEHPAALRLLHVRLWTAYAAIVAGALIAGADGIVTTLFGPGFARADVPLQILGAALIPTVLSLTLVTAGAGLEHGNALGIARAAIPVQVVLAIALARAAGIAGVAVAQLVLASVVSVAQLHWSRQPEFSPTGASGARLLALSVLVPAIALGIQQLDVPWPLRVGIGAAGCAGIALLLVVGAWERSVARRLVAFWR